MRLIALVAVVAALAVSAADIDPCKRQPFRGRCPSKNGAAPTRSQFVLRYYLRNGECVSYPYGHCARDDSEPRLFRYKEECEDACINGPGNLGSPKETKEDEEEEETSTDFDFDMTYGTVPPVPEQKAPIASVNASPSTTTEAPTTNTEVPASSTPAPRTECERRRAQSGGLVRGGFKPACTDDGSFEKMQCEPSGGQCFCVDERGIEMPNSRMHGRPDCHQILNASPMRTNECTRGSSIGPCSGSIERWFYDESQHKCFAFKYSGCGGNGNNYPNQESCMARCAPPPGTAAKCEKGEPLKTVAGTPINCEKRDCPTGYKCSVVQGSSVCCPETEKTFGALQSNTPADLCQMPKERGPCDRYELRFYYNPDARECKYFFYGGCDGNGNNFEKVEDCERRCNVTKPTRFTNGHVAQTLNPTQPASGPVRITTTTERPTRVPETTQRPTTTHSTTTPPPPPTREPLQKVFPLKPVQVPDQQMLLEKINEKERSNRCQHPRDAGTCRGQFVRWFFNTEIGNCEVFTYTGCAGNGNNFASREECLLTCSRDVPNVANVCLHDVDAGECNGVFERFAFDHESGECRKFTYGGCGGNGNNFAALPDCEKKCGGPKVAAITNTANVPPPTVNICDHPVDKGPCTGTFGRFAFDPLTGDCQQFTYGGCAGNGNNFASLSDCRRVCLKSKTASTTEAAPVLQCPPTPRCLEGCQLVRDHHGCFICNCNRPHAPAPMPPATQCPSIDINACAEPCIVFKNRRGCQECVCPLPQPTFNGNSVTVNQAVPPALPTASAQPPAPRVAQPAPPAPRAPAPPAPAPVRQPEPARTFQPQPPAPVARPVHVEPPRFEPRPPAPPAPIRVESVRTQENIHKVPLPEFEKPTDAPRRQFAQFNEKALRENFHQIQTNSQQIPIRIEEEVRAERPQNTQASQRLQPLQPSVVPSQITEKCMQPVEPGPCKNYVDRFYFNFEDGQCHAFKYGGCAGNRNHFFTMKECEIHCARFGRFVSSPPKIAAAGVPQVAVSATPEVNNAQYVPATPPMRAAAFGKQNMEIHPISLTTLEKLATTEQLDSSTEAGIDAPNPPGTDNEKSEQVEDITPPRAVPPVTFNSPDVSITAQTEATTPEDVPTSTTSTSEMFETTVMEEVSGEEISSARTEHQQTSTSSTNAEQFDLPSTTPTLDSEESEEEEVETTDDDFEASDIETTVSANPATQNTESTMSPSTRTTLEATSSYNAPHLKEVKIQPKKLNKPEFVVVEEHTRTPTADFTESTTISTSTLSTVAATTTVPVTTLQPTTTSENVTPVQSETTVEDTSRTATVTENAIADEDEEDLIESTESETIDATTETAPQEEDEDITDDEENEDSDSDNVRGVAGGVANVPSAPPVSTTVVATTTVESTTTVAATTTTSAPSTTASPATTVSTTPIPVQPDAAGREPVPLAPVGIGRSMQGVNIDEIDNLEPTSQKVVKTDVPSSATQPPRNRATESAPTQTNNSQRHREETFNAVIVCAMPPDAGVCRNYVPRWFFNAQTGQCEQFSFGNCGGNANNFMDRATCELRCVPMHRPINVLSQVPDRCALERDQGFGRGYNVKWYFNMKNLRCEQFVYEGQGGNENQFETLTDCESYCTPRGRTHYVSLPTTRQTTIQTSPATVPTTTQSTHAPTQAPTQQPKEPSIEPAPPAISDYSNEELQGETLSEEDRNVLQEIPDRVKSFEDDSHEDVLGPEPPVPDNEATLAPNPPGFEPRPPAIHSAKTENVAAPQPIPNVAADLDDKPKQSYKTEPLPAISAPTGNENLPIVGPSPPESVNYQTGQKAKAQGILNFGEINAIDTDKFDLPDDDEEDSPVAMPACPNGLQAHRYVDGRPVQCLPGRNQCPSDSVCYFNGVDYFCCPNVEDPYDKHVFGGYDGEESKHGYKAFGPLKIQRLRDDPIRDRKRRQTAFSMDEIVMPLRFDAEKPRQFAAASVVRSSNRRRKQPNKNHVIQALSASGMDIAVCVQELAKGDCSEAHLRYFYDRDSDSCRLFYYSGCKGNGNNFGSLDDCQKTCVLGMKQMQDVGATVEVPVPAGQCPGGKLPLGGAAPVLCGNNTDSIGCPVGYHCRQGPPDVCCPGQDIPTTSLDTLLGARGDVRFAPQNSEEVVVTTTTIATTKKSFLEVPEFVCPDASDPLFGKNGRPLMCGAGFDGVKMCPKGFYCAIDSVKGTRLCCPLLGVGSRIPNQKVSAPYFGRRPANPGEVIERGSLPVDQTNFQELPPKQDTHSESSFSEDEQSAEASAQQTAPSGTSVRSEEIEHLSQEDVAHSQGPSNESDDTEEEASEETESETEETKADFAKLRLKPENPHVQKQQQAAEASQQVHQAESDGVSIDTNPELSVEETTTLKQTNDRSICQLTPSEGRACREDEVPPRTNLHYFFSTKDNRCKLYFYRGCGGNANRFEKKAQCEAMCLNRS